MRRKRLVPVLPRLSSAGLPVAGRSLQSFLFAIVIFGACRSGLQEETVTSARPMAGVVAYGDCVEARRRAAADPYLDVDSVPRPVSQRPRPLARIPATVQSQLDKKPASVKVDVIVDTLGRPEMDTFKVVQSSHPWLAQNLRAAMPTWRFRAARLAGCKVRRVYHFSATSKPRK